MKAFVFLSVPPRLRVTLNISLYQRQPNRAAIFVAIQGCENDFMAANRIFQIAMRFDAIRDALDQVVDFRLERVVGNVAGIGADRRNFDPVRLCRERFRPDAIVDGRPAVAKNANRETVWHDAFGIDANFCLRAIVEFDENHFEPIVFHRWSVVAPRIIEWIVFSGFSFTKTARHRVNFDRNGRFARLG